MSEKGSALIAILVFLLFTSAAASLTFPKLLQQQNHGRLSSAERRLSRITLSADEAFRNAGSFPTRLSGLQRRGYLRGRDRVDPFGAGDEFGYRSSASSVSVRSKGWDRRAGTGDDLAFGITARNAGRARTRNRLRILRALFYRSLYVNARTMSVKERKRIREALRRIILDRRQLVYVGAAERARIRARIATTSATVARLLAAHAIPTVPQRATGPGGLLESLGLPDSLGTDGFGNTFVTGGSGTSTRRMQEARSRSVVGLSSTGMDGAAGTIDDF